MAHDIEADYNSDYHNEDKHCRLCDSFVVIDGKNYCKELEQEVSVTGNCDFFREAD